MANPRETVSRRVVRSPIFWIAAILGIAVAVEGGWALAKRDAAPAAEPSPASIVRGPDGGARFVGPQPASAEPQEGEGARQIAQVKDLIRNSPPPGEPGRPAPGLDAKVVPQSGKISPPVTVGVENQNFRPGSGEFLQVYTGTQGDHKIKISIRSLDEKPVKTLFEGQAGTVQTTWDGKAADGSPAPAGDYYLMIETPGRVEKRAVHIDR